MKKKGNNYFNKEVIVKVPSRIHLDVMNIHKMNINKVGGGGIGIAISMCTYIKIKIIDNKRDVIIAEKEKTASHILNLIRERLNINYKFKIICKLDERIKLHSGFGSNAIIQTGIVVGVNELLGKPLTDEEIISFIQENYYEESNNKITKEVYCSGVAHNTIIHGGICFIDEEGKLIYCKHVPNNYRVMIIKGDYYNLYENNQEDKDKLIVNLRKNNDVNNYYLEKDNMIRKNIIKDLKENNFTSFIKGMKEFSKKDDSRIISKQCKINKLTYDKLVNKIKGIDNTIIRISSNSPHIYIISCNIDDIINICEKYNIEFDIYCIENDGIKIIERIS